MNFAGVHSVTIHEGDVKSIAFGGVTVWTKPNPLPYDAEVEYLSSNGSQWIDTGFAPTFPSNLEYKARMRFPSTTWRYLHGLQGGMYFGVVPGGNLQVGQSGTDNTGVAVSTSSAHDFDIVFHLTQPSQSVASSIDYDMDGSSGTVSTYIYNYKPADAPVWIFAANDANSLRGPSEIYSFQILVNGTLVRDFIPVRVGTTGYLYDRASGTLFGNAGTGNFTLGPDKT